MDGVLARANCLLITTLWTAFKFVMVPLGAKLATVFTPSEFAVVFALIWGSYIAADALSEIGGALYGKQKILVRGIGDVNRKSIGGTVAGFAGSLSACGSSARTISHRPGSSSRSSSPYRTRCWSCSRLAARTTS
jgi:dolichol kinase